MTFNPQLGDLYTMMAVCGAAFAALVFLAFRLNRVKSKDPRQKVLLPMLAYFLSLLALMGFLGAFWSVFKFPAVEVSEREFIVGEEAFPLPRPHEVRLETNPTSGLGRSTRVLLVQTKDRRTWAFPEDRYDINALMRALRE